jgi:uncharacterized membrane protein
MVSNLCAQDPIDDLGDRVRVIFQGRCVGCHGPDVSKPKGKFGFVTDLARVAEKYGGGGSLDDSDLWGYLTGAPKLMPPPESESGPLTAEEMAIVRWWLTAGTPEPLRGGSSDGTVSTPTRAAAPPEEAAEFATKVFGRSHVVLVHFPIGLLLAAALAEFLRVMSRNPHLPTVVRFCLLLGTLGACAAAASGWVLSEVDGVTGSDVDTHRWFGVGSAVGSLVVLILERLGASRGGGLLTLYRIALFALAAAVGWTGHLGGTLVHGAGHLGF